MIVGLKIGMGESGKRMSEEGDQGGRGRGSVGMSVRKVIVFSEGCSIKGRVR